MALFVLHTILRDFAASIAVSILLHWTISSPKIEGKQILDFQLHVDCDNEINCYAQYLSGISNKKKNWIFLY